MNMNSKTILASLCALFAWASSFGAVNVTASRDYVDKRTKLSAVTNAEYGVVGYTIGTNTNSVVASTSYVDRRIGEADPGDYSNVSNAAVNARAKTDLNVYTNGLDGTSNIATGDRLATTGDVAVAMGSIKTDLITDGTNTIDAARNVWNIGSGTYAPWIVSTNGIVFMTLTFFSDEGGSITWRSGDGSYIGFYDGNWTYSVYYFNGQLTGDENLLSFNADIFVDFQPINGVFERKSVYLVATNYAGRLALTNQIPDLTLVVAYGGNGKKMGEWSFSDGESYSVSGPSYNGFVWLYSVSGSVEILDSFETEDEALDATVFSFVNGGGDLVTATRVENVAAGYILGGQTNKVLASTNAIPTKTSQIVNDGTNGIPFATIADVPRSITDSITDGTNIIDAAGNVLRKELSPWYIKSYGNMTYDPFIRMTYRSYYVDQIGYRTGWMSDVPIGEGEYMAIDDTISYVVYYSMNEDVYTIFTGDTISEHTSTNITSLGSGATSCYIFRESEYEIRSAGKLALTNDIPPATAVVAPSTNAITGQAADAKEVGDALWTGFTEWVFGQLPSGVSNPSVVGYGVEAPNTWVLSIDYFGETERYETEGAIDDLAVDFSTDYGLVAATRHLVTPTKTSQLVNNGSNGVPYATVNDLPIAITDGTNTIDAAGNVWTNFIGWTFSDGESHAVYKAYDPEYSPESPWGLYIDTTDLGPGISWYATEEARDGATSFTDDRFDPPITATYHDGPIYAGKLALTNDMPSLAGKTYDFSTNVGLFSAMKDIIEALGGSVTNFPAIGQ